MTLRVGVLASGRGSNLEAMLKAELGPAAVVVVLSNVAEAGALAVAEDHGIKTETVPHKGRGRAGFDEALVAALKPHRLDWVVLAGFMRIVGPKMLAAYSARILNIHPSLLPSFPGLHAQRQALEAGVRVSGCTVHLVDSGMDTGPIVAQAAVEVLVDDTESTLSQRILRQEHILLPAVLRALAEDQFVAYEGGLKPADLTTAGPSPQDALLCPGVLR